MRLKIVSDGLAHGTKVVNAETGEKVEGVTRVVYAIDANRGYGVALIRVHLAEVDVTGEAEVRKEKP